MDPTGYFRKRALFPPKEILTATGPRTVTVSGTERLCRSALPTATLGTPSRLVRPGTYRAAQRLDKNGGHHGVLLSHDGLSFPDRPGAGIHVRVPRPLDRGHELVFVRTAGEALGGLRGRIWSSPGPRPSSSSRPTGPWPSSWELRPRERGRYEDFLVTVLGGGKSCSRISATMC